MSVSLRLERRKEEGGERFFGIIKNFLYIEDLKKAGLFDLSFDSSDNVMIVGRYLLGWLSWTADNEKQP